MTRKGCPVLAAAALCLFLSAPSPAAPPQPPGVWTHPPYPAARVLPPGPIISARIDPEVILLGRDTFRVMVGVGDAQVVSVTMIEVPWYLLRHGVPVTTMILHDDGTRGDEVAGDHVFTTDDITFIDLGSPGGSMISRAPLRYHRFRLGFAGGGSVDVDQDLGLSLAYVSSEVPIPAVTPLAPDAQRTDHVLNLVKDRSGEFPDHYFDFQVATQRYYQLLPDNRDFLILTDTFNHATSYAATFGAVRNDVSGIGLSIYDSSTYYGSNSVLHGIMNTYQGFHSFFTTLNHEYLHRWCAFLDWRLDLASPTSHWDAIERPSSAFIMGPYAGVFTSIEPDAPGRFACRLDPSDSRASDLELYLMGLAPPAEIASPIRTLVEPRFVDLIGGVYYYEAQGLREVTVAEVLAVEGPRLPDARHSQMSFKSGMIVVSDRLLTPTELAFFDYPLREYEKPTSAYQPYTFHESTLGRARIYTDLDAVDPPVCGLSATTLDFGRVAIGDTARVSLVVANQGGGRLLGRPVASCAELSTEGFHFDLGAGDSTEVEVAFSPIVDGPWTCELAIGASCEPVILTGEGVASCEIVTTNTDLGRVELGETGEGSFRVRNWSSHVLSGSIEEDCPEWSVAPAEFSIPAGGEADFVLTFVAALAGVHECTIVCDPCSALVARAEVPPRLVAPADGSVGAGLPVTFRWAATPPGRSAGAAPTFRLQVSRFPEMSPLVLDLATRDLEHTSAPGELEPATSYYWRVGVEWDGGVTACTPVWSFESSPSPVVVSAVSAAASDWGIRVAWEAAIDSDLLGFQVLRGSGPGQPEARVGLLIMHRPYAVVDEDVTPGTDYLYTLEVLDRQGGVERHGPVAARFSPRLALAPPEPNPCAGAAALRLALPLATEIRLDLLDARGAVVRTLARGPLPAGIHHLAWNGANAAGARVAAGTYFLRLAAGAESATRKVVVLP